MSEEQTTLLPSADFLAKISNMCMTTSPGRHSLIIAREFSQEDFEFARQNVDLLKLVQYYQGVYASLRRAVLSGKDISFEVHGIGEQQQEGEEPIKSFLRHFILVQGLRGEEIHATLYPAQAEFLQQHLYPVCTVDRSSGKDTYTVANFGTAPVGVLEGMMQYMFLRPAAGAVEYDPQSDKAKEAMYGKVEKKSWLDKMILQGTEDEIKETICERSNGAYSYWVGKDCLLYMSLEGEFCLDELEAIFLNLLSVSNKPRLVGDWLDDNAQQWKHLYGSSASEHPLFAQVDPLHGITPQEAVVFRKATNLDQYDVQGMASSKGGRAWINKCTSIAALQSLIVELTYYCNRRGEQPTHFKSELMRETPAESSDQQRNPLDFGNKAWDPASVPVAGLNKHITQPLMPRRQHTRIPEADGGETYVLYHMDSDGRFAGFAAYLALIASQKTLQERDEAADHTHFIEVQYDQAFPVPLEKISPKTRIFILDFSYKRAILEEVSAKGCFIKVLDHHKTAKKELQGLPYADFDMTKSGALLAWEYFFPGTEVPRVCQYVNDRDLWLKQFPESRLVEAYLRKQGVGSNWIIWEQLTFNEAFLDEVIKQMVPVVETEDSFIGKVFKSKRHALGSFGDYRYAVYGCPGVLHSEVAEEYYNNLDVHFTIGWSMIEGGHIIFNLRSPGRCDVSKWATQMGGGGHAAAAGFRLPMEAGFDLIKQLMLDEAEITIDLKLVAENS